MKLNTKKFVLTALMAALTYAATAIIQIPSPTHGYIHPGDGIVFLSGILLGPLYGGLAAGIGSMFVDLLSGYAHYVIGTFIIKMFAAAACYYLFKVLKPLFKQLVVRTSISGIAGACVVVFGYFGYESLCLGLGISAAAGIPGNIVQTLLGVVMVSVLYPSLKNIRVLSSDLFENK